MKNLSSKQLLVVAHAPSPNTRRLRDALLRGCQHPDAEGVDTRCVAPLEAAAQDVLDADAVLLSTPENLGYMSGAMKDFFDRIYYPCLEEKQGLPYALHIRAGNDGRGTRQAVETIVTGLRWRAVADALICRGEFREEFEAQCEELGATLAVGLAAGVI